MNSRRLFSKDFTLVVAGQIISLFGNAILRFALPLYLLRETGSATLFGIVTACSFLPMIVLSFLGGVLADRVNKRNIMVCLDFLTAAIILSLTFLLGTLPLVPLLIVGLMLLYGIYGIYGTYQPTVQASIPFLVPTDRIVPTGAVINQISALASLAGPIIGGMLFGTFGITPILIISTLCFFASAIMELFITIPFEKRTERDGVFAIIRNDFKESTAYLKHENPAMFKVILMVALFNLVLTAMIIVGTPLLIVDTLGMSDQLLGISQGVLAFGGLCGGIFIALFSKKMSLSSSHLVLAGCCVCVGAMAVPFFLGASAMSCYITITAANFVCMALATVFSVQTLAAVQTTTPPQLVGKVLALMMAISMSAQPVGQAIYGVVFDAYQTRPEMILLVVALLALGISLASRKIFSRFSADGREETRSSAQDLPA